MLRSFVEIDGRFRGVYCLCHHGDIALMMDAVITCEMPANFYQTAGRNVSSSGWGIGFM
jgi:hypothetical protein